MEFKISDILAKEFKQNTLVIYTSPL
jgi:hypothetical protein